MGLDQYLSRRTYVKNWDFDKSPKYSVVVKKGGKSVSIDPKKITYVTEDVAYWRKANAVHRWFVVNVQDGNDDCGEYAVSREQLQKLVDICKKVLAASKLVSGRVKVGAKMVNGQWLDIKEGGKVIEDPSVAQDLLPTTHGFFFGGTDYDQFYVEELKSTVRQLSEALKDNNPDAVFYYSSSW